VNIKNKKMIKMNFLTRVIVFTGTVMILLSSCNLTKKYEDKEKEEIQNYLSAHPELDFTLRESGLYYLDVVVGTGDQPVAKDTAFVFYTGSFLNGNSFETNVGGDPFWFPVGVGSIIPGWDEGVMLMREGGTAKLLIPSYLAFGNSGYIMEPYTPIILDVELDSIAPGPGNK